MWLNNINTWMYFTDLQPCPGQHGEAPVEAGGGGGEGERHGGRGREGRLCCGRPQETDHSGHELARRGR